MEPRIVFEDDQTIRSSTRFTNAPSGITGLIMRKSNGLIKSSVQANVIMVLIALISVGICYWLLTPSNNALEEYTPPAGYKVVNPANAPPRLERQ